MHSFSITEIKAFVPAKDFSLSLAFYADMGFEARSNAGGIAYLGCNDCSFLLQDFYVESHAQNFMMHILVADVQAWYEKLDLPPSDVHFFGLKKGYVAWGASTTHPPDMTMFFGFVDMFWECVDTRH